MLQSTTTTQFTVNVNSPFPSTKNGRRSLKKVSNALRLSSDGIRLHLAEVRVDRRVEQQVRGDPVPQIAADRDVLASAEVGSSLQVLARSW